MVVWILVVVGVIVVAVVLGVIFSAASRRTQLDQSPLSSPEAPGMARSGAVGWEKFKCQECGAELGENDVTARGGLTFVSCSYCGSTYQLVEEPQ